MKEISELNFPHNLRYSDDHEWASQYAVLNANYLRQSLKGAYHLRYDRPCMHECVFTDEIQNRLREGCPPVAVDRL